MMPGVMYDVIARYKVDTTGTNTPLDGVASRADRASSALGGVAGALAAIGGAGAALGILNTVGQRLIQLNSEAVEARIGVASILTLNGLGDFQTSMGRATSLTQQLRKAAKETKGETSDLINIVSTSLPGFAGINPSNSDLVTFAKRATAATNVLLGSDFDLGGQQLLQIFSGQAGSDNRLFQAIRKPLMEQLGIKSTGSKAVEDFNKLATTDQQKIFTALTTVLGSFDEANKLLNNTIGGQLNALGDNANGLLLRVGEPLTKLVTEKLGVMNDFFDKNEEKINKVADAIGTKLAGAIETFGKYALIAARNVDVLLASSAGLLAMRQLGAQTVVSALVNWPSALIGGGRAAIGAAGAGLTGQVGRLNLGARASALGSFIAPMALRSSDNWMMGGAGQRAALTARMGWWRFSDAASRAPGAVASRAANALGMAGALADPRWAFANTGQRGLMLARAGGAAGLARAGGALGLTGLTASQGWLYGTGIQRAGLVASTVGRTGAGGVANLLGGLATSALGKSLVALLRVAGPVGLAIGGIVGVMQVLQDKTNSATATFFDMTELLFVELDKLAAAFGYGAGDGGAAGMVKKFTTMLGEGLVNVLSFTVWGVAQLVKGLGYLAYIIEGIAGGLGALYMQYAGAGGGLAGLKALNPTTAFAQGFSLADDAMARREAEAAAMARKRDADEKKKKQDEIDAAAAEKAKKPPVVNVKIEQRIETDANPERIAYKTGELISDLFTTGRVSVDRFT